MSEPCSSLIGHIWKRMSGSGSANATIFRRIQHDGGLDTASLVLSDVDAVLEQRASERWKEIGFGLSELLAYYLAVGREMTDEQTLTSVFSICGLADASRADAVNWPMERAKVHALLSLLAD